MPIRRQARLNRQRVPIAHGPETVPRVEGFENAARAAGERTSLGPSALALRRLANLLASYTPHDGVVHLRLPGTYAIRLSRMTTETAYATLGPALCVAAQGAKVIMLGREMFEYDPAHLLVFAVDLPVSSQVTRASRKDPYLGFTMGPGSRACRRIGRPRLPPRHPEGVRQSGALRRTLDRRDRRRRLAPARTDGPPRRCDLPRAARRRRNPDTSVAHADRQTCRANRPAEVRRAANCRCRLVDPRALCAASHGRGDGRRGAHERLVVPPALQGPSPR
jgi:hypothetical protein